MRIRGLLWLDEIVEKLWAKHHLDVTEVREVLESQPRFRFVERGRRKGEDLYAGLGQTASGRYLIVFFILKSDQTALVISARDMTKAEKKKYERG